MDETIPQNEIQKNFVYLCENMSNFNSIVIHLIEKGIISDDERQQINSENTPTSKSVQLLSLLQRKDWPKIKPSFITILRKTWNIRCADLIERTTILMHGCNKGDILDGQTWWPDEKRLPVAFYVRKSEDRSMVEKLKEMLSKEQSEGMTVITHNNVTVSGLGGVGKTSTAIWYAQTYKEEYRHIIWIDCGDKNLLNSFENLARALDLKHRLELDLKHLAIGCYNILKHYKCLLIFDNAEGYNENEGVKGVIPKLYKNFHVIITSRQKKWGNSNGDGVIPQLQLEVFEKNEGVEFLQRSINDTSNIREEQLKILCDLLGNLPLALQIAVATINQNKLASFESYIESIKSSPDILHAKFDNYQTTLDKTIKISLEFIKGYEINGDQTVGELAFKMLTIFGYIRPDDVPSEFFLAIEKNSNKADVDAAALLLESYSLVTTKQGPDEKYTLSIHRLLQMFIQYNSPKAKGNEILHQILDCKGFLEYKLIPFNFADEELQNNFPVLKHQLIGKLKLNELLKEKKFEEAVELARLINNTLHDPVSEFNFAICLLHNRQTKESKQAFENLKEKSNRPGTFSLYKYTTEWGIIHTSTTPSINIIMGRLFSIYSKEKNVEKARTAFLECKQIPLAPMPMEDLINLLQWLSLPNIYVQMHERDKCITLNVDENKQVNESQIIRAGETYINNTENYRWRKAMWKNNRLFLHNVQFVMEKLLMVNTIIMEHCSVDISILPRLLKTLYLKNCILLTCPPSAKDLRIHLKKLSLINISVKESNQQRRNHLDISCFISPTLKKLEVNCFTVIVSLKHLEAIQYIHLAECALELDENIGHIAPTKLTLNNVRLVDGKKGTLSTPVNDFVQFKYIRYLHLIEMTINFKDLVYISELTLINAKLLNWENGRWMIGKLSIFPSQGQTQMVTGHTKILKGEPGKNNSTAEFRKRKLLKYFENNCGSKTIAGLYSKHCLKDGIEKIRRITGVLPGILSTRLPKFLDGKDAWQSFIEETIFNWHSGHLVHIRWNYEGHPLEEILKGYYESSWMDLINDGGARNALWKEKLDFIAPFLQQLQTAGVLPIFDLLPFLNYPLYLWGGRRGSQGSMKLYQITREYLTQQHGLNSLIWSLSLSAHGDMIRLEDYWPGNGYVDVVAVFMGSRRRMTTNEYEKLLDLRKPLSMEHMWFVPKTKLLAKQPQWTWFSAFDDYLTHEKYNDEENTRQTFNSVSVINEGNNNIFSINI